MRSLAPVLPPRAAAQTRVKALRADADQASSPALRAMLELEIGALTETRLDDPAGALRSYEAAASADPSFRPALLALVRVFRERGDRESDERLVELLEALVRASTNDREAAGFLVELGVLHDDRRIDGASARLCFEQALTRDPSCRAALLMLERSARAQRDAISTGKLVRQRAAHTKDPVLRSTLQIEAAELALRERHVDDAIALLVAAAEDRDHRYAVLERLARLAQNEARWGVAAQAYEDMAELVSRGLAGAEREAIGGSALAVALGQDARATGAWLWQQAGRLRANELQDPEAARRAFDAAHALAPDDDAIGLDRLAATASSDDIAAAHAQLTTLLARTELAAGRRASLEFQRAELCERAGDRQGARAALLAALDADPESAATLAVLEDSWLDDGEFAALCAHLEALAERTSGAERTSALLRAAAIAADRAKYPARALAHYRTLVASADDPTPLLREAYGTALRAGDTRGLLWAARALLERDLDDAEASSLVRECYEAELALGETDAARATLRLALDHPACESWAAHAAVVSAGLSHDFVLLAEAHARLSSQAQAAQDLELAAAHLCAEARARFRLADAAGALACAERALQLSPGHGYAVALAQELLIARGDATDAAHVLREAAASARDAHASELALLHAGAAAELAGRIDLAAQSYEEAIDRHHGALSPLWSLWRLGARAREPRVVLSALEGLALREGEQDQPGVASLELAERYDSIGKPELSVAPLLAAVDALPIAAGVAAMVLPENPLDPELRPRAAAALVAALDGEASRFVARERIRDVLHDSPHEARRLLEQLGDAPETAGDALAQLLASRSTDDRVQALAALARLSEDPDTQATFALHARRISQLMLGADERTTLASAIDSAEQSPDTLAAAIGLDEALGAGEAAELRVSALEARLAHTPAELQRGLRVALARALLDAGRTRDAAEDARELLREDPRELSAWEVLRVAARAQGALEDVVLACDTLAASAQGELRGLLFEEAAAVLEDDLARPADAEARLRAALEADPRRLPAFERLHDLLVARHDIEGLVTLVSARVGHAASNEERLDLLYEQARLLRALGEREAALVCVDEVLGSEPDDPGALGLAAEIHASQQDWPSAVEALRLLARSSIPAAQRKLACQGAADFLEKNLDDVPAAYRELAELARAGLADFAVWKRMAELAQRAQLWNEAVGALEQAAQLAQGSTRAALERRAGAILGRDSAHHDGARKAYARALAALPTDIDACEALSALSNGPERVMLLTTFTATVLTALSREPAHPELLRALRRVSVLASDATLEHVALSTLRTLDLATPEEADVYLRLDAHLPDRPSDVFTDEQLDVLGRTGLPEPALRFARIACKAQLDASDDTPARHGVTRQDRVAKAAAHAERDALVAWVTSFGLQVSELYVGGRDAHDVRMVQTPGSAQAWVIGRDVRAPFDVRQRFEIAQQCVAMRLQVAPLVTLGRDGARDLLRSVAAAVDARSSQALAPSLLAQRDELGRKLSRGQRRELGDALAAMPDPATMQLALIERVDQLGLRAGLLACCDLRTALAAVLGARFDPNLVAGSASALALVRFWTSNTLVVLRRELGLVP